MTVCPKDTLCRKKWGKGKLKRAVSAGAGLIFKGSGFYITDYRSENYKAGAKKDSAPAGESKPAGEGKSAGDAKPSPTKTETKTAKAVPAAKPAD